ncbi:SpoIID/LytB domain-containing protein [Paenibacillus thermoaerophilus]|uniref:SpoIID/LytB domain-containing protein n=1 Tax=Paenibacillus thermoaerophilus TaxID=1215385 RepID=A0ABW2UYR5_9BACL|nr:SpoIID/LytB domain-containing protein [Paenibacillus thermoaerophilus]TMV17307.1 SpoIID/LytB domain-containing protein [Paenibacillus thermoaerophilus]
MARTKKTRLSAVRKAGVAALASLLLIASGAGLERHVPVAAAAGQHTIDTIRVALYMQSDLAFKSTVPYATVSHPKGLTIGLSGAAAPLTSVTPGVGALLSYDGYRVQLLETSDAAAADRAAGAVSADKPVIRKQKVSGKDVYQVVIGPYASLEEAEAKRDALKGAVQGGSPKVLGTIRWSTGAYASEAEAVKQAASLAAKGVASAIGVTVADGGQPSYEVWIGDAVSQAEADALKAAVLKQAPGVSLAAAYTGKGAPYLVIRDVRLSGGASGKSFDIAADGRSFSVTAPEDGLRVAEKNRQYRGKLEWSVYNNRLALINEVPFEQYLYSVVGTEMSASWPAEALKAQAVAARTYALGNGLRYKIAHVSDSTFDQAYYGMDQEKPAIVAAVEATRGEILLENGKVFLPFFSSNAGGMTADPSEVWGNPVSFVKVAASPDQIAAEGKPIWYRVLLPDARTGYIRSDLLDDTGARTPSGLPLLKGNTDGINIRPIPSTSNVYAAPIGTLDPSWKVVKIAEATESNDYSWMRGPYTPGELAAKLPKTLGGAPLQSLKVTGTGPSGRVTEVEANGKPIVDISYPDGFRTVFLGLPSTRFAIEETGRYRVLGADGRSRDLYGSPSEKVYAVGADGVTTELTAPSRFVTDGRSLRVGTKEAAYLFTGLGNGHGLGMSQWGAKGLAEEGYGYKEILGYYYQGVTLVKDGN